MQHIIKWKTQHNRRTKSWQSSIIAARKNIARLRKISPGITDEDIRAVFSVCFNAAQRAAEAEMQEPTHLASLSWQEVFDEEYSLPFPTA